MSWSLPGIATDFESSASANSATPAKGIVKLRRQRRSSSASNKIERLQTSRRSENFAKNDRVAQSRCRCEQICDLRFSLLESSRRRGCHCVGLRRCLHDWRKFGRRSAFVNLEGRWLRYPRFGYSLSVRRFWNSAWIINLPKPIARRTNIVSVRNDHALAWFPMCWGTRARRWK